MAINFVQCVFVGSPLTLLRTWTFFATFVYKAHSNKQTIGPCSFLYQLIGHLDICVNHQLADNILKGGIIAHTMQNPRLRRRFFKLIQQVFGFGI